MFQVSFSCLTNWRLELDSDNLFHFVSGAVLCKNIQALHFYLSFFGINCKCIKYNKENVQVVIEQNSKCEVYLLKTCVLDSWKLNLNWGKTELSVSNTLFSICTQFWKKQKYASGRDMSLIKAHPCLLEGKSNFSDHKAVDAAKCQKPALTWLIEVWH